MPMPIAPSHGVVVALPNGYAVNNTVDRVDRPNDNEPDNSDVLDEQSNFSWKTYVPGHEEFLLSSSSTFHEQKPFRVLVIGDSIARGVGQFDSCTPLFPETIAGAISTATGGRPVYWSAIGEPGSNAEWITKQVEDRLQRGKNHDDGTNDAESMDMDNANMNEILDASSKSSTTYIKQSIKSFYEHQLQLHKQQHESDSFGAYDIVLILTGVNDVKEIILPFMFESGENDFSENLRKMIVGIEDSMKTRWNRAKDSSNNKETTLSSLGTNGAGEQQVPVSSSESSSCTGVTDAEECKALLESTSQSDLSNPAPSKSLDYSTQIASKNFGKPLILLPQLTGERCPLLTLAMSTLRWAGLQIFFMIESKKKMVAEHFPEHVLATDAPQQKDVAVNILEDPVIVSLTDVSPSDWLASDEQMQAFKRSNPPYHDDDLYSLDGVHPSDKGYKFFGQYITKIILAEWRR